MKIHVVQFKFLTRKYKTEMITDDSNYTQEELTNKFYTQMQNLEVRKEFLTVLRISTRKTQFDPKEQRLYKVYYKQAAHSKPILTKIYVMEEEVKPSQYDNHFIKRNRISVVKPVTL